VPVLDGAKGWVAGPVVERFDVGDHVAFVVDAESGAAEEPPEEELGFQAVKDLEPGHAP
jgi:flavin reductase (DIM6/NTAB) family NADH-FMN oxidoreductase RutF